MHRFENIPIVYCNIGAFRNGASMAVPGIGIVISKKYVHDIQLLRHEYGHFLQAKRWGYFFFYFRVAFSSLMSVIRKPRYHKYHWTEWSANYLSYHYFDDKENWDMESFPIQPEMNRIEIKFPLPRFCKDVKIFHKKYLEKFV